MCVDNQLESVIREDADITPHSSVCKSWRCNWESDTDLTGGTAISLILVKARMRVAERNC